STLLLSSLAPPPASTPFPYTTLFRSRRLSSRAVWTSGERPREPSTCRSLLILSIRLGPAWCGCQGVPQSVLSIWACASTRPGMRSEEHTSELQSRSDLVCRLLLEKKK